MEQHIIDWFEAVATRYDAMDQANVDNKGLKNLLPVLEKLSNNKLITSGECEYLYDRFHPNGRYPHYNTKNGYDKKYGSVPTMPILPILRHHCDNRRFTHTPRFTEHFPNIHDLTDHTTFDKFFQFL